MKKRLPPLLVILLIVSLACGGNQAPADLPVPSDPISPDRTAYGFFPTPARFSLTANQDIYKLIGQHADVVLLQQAVPWKDFKDGVPEKSQVMDDIRGQYTLAYQNNLNVIFMVDPLNGLNRRQFADLPKGWDANFSNPDVRSAFTNFAMYILRTYHPAYMGLGSEVNTYTNAYPEDYPNYLSLYQEVYDQIKAESPETQVFVSFQWEEMNNLFEILHPDKARFEVDWDQFADFEPRLDLWAISSYPFVAFDPADSFPDDYYSRLLDHTDKPLAIAEGGIPAIDEKGEQQQIKFLNEVDRQIGSRLTFWIYLNFSDFEYNGMAFFFALMGHFNDLNTLRMFTHLGFYRLDNTAKPALAVWDQIRTQ
jgi:hypothetical protein